MLPGEPCRMVVKACHRGTGQVRLFPALISRGQDSPAQLGDAEILTTVTVTGDDAGGCLPPGEPFTLWRGGHIGDGVITRRLFA